MREENGENAESQGRQWLRSSYAVTAAGKTVPPAQQLPSLKVERIFMDL